VAVTLSNLTSADDIEATDPDGAAKLRGLTGILATQALLETDLPVTELPRAE